MRRFRIDRWQISCGKRSNRGKILPAIDFNPRPRLSSPASANCLLVSEIIVYLDQKTFIINWSQFSRLSVARDHIDGAVIIIRLVDDCCSDQF